MNVRTFWSGVVVGLFAALAQFAQAWPPNATNDSYTVVMNSTLTVASPGVLANDRDPDGNKISAQLVRTTTNGSLTFSTNGSFTYKPNTNFIGADAFTYRAFDGKLTSSVATATITVTPLPIAVTKSPTNVTVCPGATATFSVTVSGTAPRYQWRFGTNTLAGQTNNTLVLPNVAANSAGTYSVVVTGAAGNSITNSATLSLNVATTATSLTNAVRSIGGVVIFSTTAGGTGPFSYQWKKGSTNLVGKTNSSLLLTNLVSSDAGTYSVVVSGSCGSVTRSATLMVDYCFPAVDVTLVLDRSGSMKGAPYADALSAASNFVKNFKLGGTNDQLALVSYATTPTLDQMLTNSAAALLGKIGSLPGANGYTCISCAIQTAQSELSAPRRNPDALPVMVLLTDGQPSNGDTDAKAVEAATAAKNAGTRVFTVGFGDVEDSLMSAMASSPGDYFRATNSSQLTALFNAIAAIICRSPTNISVVGLTNQTVCSGGSVTMSITASNCVSFNYQWRKDGSNLAGQTNRTLVIPNAAVTDSGVYSVVVSSACQTLTNSAVLTVNQSLLVNTPPANQTSVVGSNVTFTVDAVGSGITYQWYFKGALVGTARALTLSNVTTNQSGNYCVVLTGTCGAPITNCATLSFQNRAPVAKDDAYAVDEDKLLVIAAPGVLANDSDPDGDSLTPVLVTGPSHGALTLNPDGSFNYLPATNFNGSDSFTYRASDSVTTSSAATVRITVRPINDPPIANNDGGDEIYRVLEDHTLVVTAPGVLANDTDVDGDPLTAIVVSNPTHGVVALKSDGSFTYTPETNFFGTDTFRYRANDRFTSSLPATVTIAVVPVNDPPSFTPGPNVRVNFNSGAQSIPWATNIRPGPGNESNQVVRFNVTTTNTALFSAQPAISSNGVLTFTPAGIGSVTISVTAQDNGGTANGGVDTSAPATFTLSLNGPPFVNIVTPSNNAVFVGTNTFSVVAEAGDADGVVTNVTLFEGTNVIGNFTNEPYAAVLTNVPPRVSPYQFRAIAVDDLGLTATSSVITVVVTQSPPVTALGPIVLNRQNGLFEQYARISNPTPQDFLAGVRLFINLNGATNDRVFNATGTNSQGIPYIDIHTPVLSGTYIDVLVQYYVANSRVVPNVTLSAVPLPFVKPVPPAPVLIATGPNGSAPFRFKSTRGAIYMVQWSTDLRRWETAKGILTGTGSPITINASSANGSRFCRVLMLP